MEDTMYHGITLRHIRDDHGKLVGFTLTTGADAWGEDFVQGFLPRLVRGHADIFVGADRILFKKDVRTYQFPLSTEDAQDVDPIVERLVEAIRREANPQIRFKYLSMPGGFRIISEDLQHLNACGAPIRPNMAV